MPKIGIVYVPWKYRQYVPDVFDAWTNLNYPKDRIELFLIPNGEQETKDLLESKRNELKDFGHVHIAETGQNIGFSRGHNQGIQLAIARGCAYVYLNNGDLKMEPNSLLASVNRAETDPSIASVQSLVRYWKKPEMINVSGGMIHIFGYGFARDNLRILPNDYAFEEQIAYGSCAAILFNVSALQQVGLLEEGFFMYHEDLELGLRLRMAGYVNVLEPTSIALHDYGFAKNTGMFGWIELYRWIVMLSYFRLATLFLLVPVMLLHEVSTWFFALRGGWLKAKLWEYSEIMKPKTWALLFRMRARAKRLRHVSDRKLLKWFTGRIEAQEQSNWIVERTGNPLMAAYTRFLQLIVIW